MKTKTIGYTAILAMLLATCSYKHQESPEPAKPCTSPDTVSFEKDIVPILNNNCSTAGCHSGNNPEGNLNLESSKAYASLQKKGSGYVDTLNPESSVVYSSLVSKSSPMPPTGNLDSCSIKLFKIWMQQKAKNN